VHLQTLKPDWNCPVVVAATGPSLTPDVASVIRRARWPQEKCRVVAVNDAYRLLPYADVLYACDAAWWKLHIDAVRKTFHGEQWTSCDSERGESNSKDTMADWGVRFISGKHADTFSTDPAAIHYGSNSGFQAVNFAILKGATKIILVGFDMRGRGHFFGDHPEPLHNRNDYEAFLVPFRYAASKKCTVPIVNATPGSALDCFPMVELDDALNDSVHRHGAEPYARTGAGGAG
jgi:hypothetical protein